MARRQHIGIVGVSAAMALVLGSAAASATAPPSTTPSTGNDHVFTVGEIAIPAGDPGVVSIALTGPSDGSSVPMVIRNNTAEVVYDVEVIGVARDAAGTLHSIGSSQGFEPIVVEPGEWAMGYVYFDFDVLTGSETFEWQTQFDSDPGFLGKVELTVGEAEFTAGGFTPQVVGIVLNESAEPVSGPNSVYVACFDGDVLLSVESGYTEGDEIPVGGFSPFSVDLYSTESCPAYAIASSGWTF